VLSVQYGTQRREVITIARKMTADGLVVGTAGNVSLRCGDLVAVTPTGVEYDELTIEDIALVRLDGTSVAGRLKPTSELPMHLAAYARPDVSAVVHTHALHATALSLLRDDVPAVHYQLAEFGGNVRVAEYATYGSDQLARNMSAALGDLGGCILRSHGTITVGTSLTHAYNRTRHLEWLCELWLTAQAVGSPRVLEDDELARVADKLTTYGQ
jgi:L-fuculose-phosphate aldolase